MPCIPAEHMHTASLLLGLLVWRTLQALMHTYADCKIMLTHLRNQCAAGLGGKGKQWWLHNHCVECMRQRISLLHQGLQRIHSHACGAVAG